MKSLTDLNMKTTIKNPGLSKINNNIDTFLNEYDKKYDFYLIKNAFNLVFNNPQYVVNIETSPHKSRITLSLGYLLNDVINAISNRGYIFDRIDEFNIITIADKMDMTHKYYINHPIQVIEKRRNFALIHIFN